MKTQHHLEQQQRQQPQQPQTRQKHNNSHYDEGSHYSFLCDHHHHHLKKKKRKSTFFLVLVTVAMIILLLSSSSNVHAMPFGIPPMSWPLSCWRTSAGNDMNSTTKSSSLSSSWSTVDPSKIIALMIKHGGLVLPNNRKMKQDLDLLSKVCHASKVELNMIEQKLVVYNFTVDLPTHETSAIRIKRLDITWDSYLKPCLEIEINDVDIVLEFFNVFLTNHNWKQLHEVGFPPKFTADIEDEAQSDSASSSFVRIGSIDLTNCIVKFRITSQPLQEDLGYVEFDFKAFKSLHLQIKKQSTRNMAKTGRKGCTTDELYQLIHSDFQMKIRSLMSDALQNFASNEEEYDERLQSVAIEVNRIVKATKDSISKYIEDTTKYGGNRFQKKIQEWSVSVKENEKVIGIWDVAKMIHKELSSSRKCNDGEQEEQQDL